MNKELERVSCSPYFETSRVSFTAIKKAGDSSVKKKSDLTCKSHMTMRFVCCGLNLGSQGCSLAGRGDADALSYDRIELISRSVSAGCVVNYRCWELRNHLDEVIQHTYP